MGHPVGCVALASSLGCGQTGVECELVLFLVTRSVPKIFCFSQILEMNSYLNIMYD